MAARDRRDVHAVVLKRSRPYARTRAAGAMSDPTLHPHLATPAELQERIHVERAGQPFLIYRERGGRQRIVVLADGTLRVGREQTCDLCIDWDGRVSALHAELSRSGPDWLVIDDGL